MDDGSSFEIGFAKVLGKVIFGYLDHRKPLLELVENRIPTSSHSSGYRIDNDGYLLSEDFGNSINLMLEFAILESGGQLIQGNFEETIQVISQSLV